MSKMSTRSTTSSSAVVVAVVMAALFELGTACDAGVFFGKDCTQELADKGDPRCFGWPQNANATSAFSVLTWIKGVSNEDVCGFLGGNTYTAINFCT